MPDLYDSLLDDDEDDRRKRAGPWSPNLYDRTFPAAGPGAPRQTPTPQSAYEPSSTPLSDTLTRTSQPGQQPSADDELAPSWSTSPFGDAWAQQGAASPAPGPRGQDPSRPDRFPIPEPARQQASRGQRLTQYRDSLTKLQQTSDPQQQAIQRDQLARSLFTDLKTAGHNVNWDGDLLVIDGRRYEVATGQPSGGIMSTDPAARNPATGMPQQPAQTAQAALGAAPGGFDPRKWADPTHTSPKYIVGRALSRVADQLRAIPDEAGRKAFVEQQLRALVPAIEQRGMKVLDIRAEKMLIDANDSKGPLWMDAIRDIEGVAEVQWIGPGDGDLPIDRSRAPRRTAPGAGGVPVGGAPAGPPRPAWPEVDGGPDIGGAWTPSAQTYQPGDVPFEDVPTWSLDDLMARMGSGAPADPLDASYEGGRITNDPLRLARAEDDYQAGTITNDPLRLARAEDDYGPGTVRTDPLATYGFKGFGDLGDLGAGPTDPATEALVMSILRRPESLDPHTVGTLKARTKDELAEMARTEDADLLGFGYETGIQDSNFLESERNTARGRRDQALVASNRAIDLEAAARNLEDRRAAAAIGGQYAEGRAGRGRADRALRGQEAVAGEGLAQAEVESQNQSTRYQREGDILSEQMRGQAFERRQGARLANRAAQEREAEFLRTGELEGERVRGEAADRRMRGQSENAARRRFEAEFGRQGELENERLRGDAFDRRTRVAQQNIDNAFRSAADKRAAVGLAADQTLKAAAARQDRYALREAIKQKATELGQNADKLMADYTLGLLSDATRRYGIDVGAAIDRQKLGQAGREFQEDLAFRIASLAQSDKQFGARLGLDTADLQLEADRDAWDRYSSVFGDERE